MRAKNSKQFQQPDLTDVLEELREDVFKNINCVQIGVIEAFDANTQSAAVQISIKQVIDVQQDGTQRFQSITPLVRVPVMILSGGSSHLTMPVQQGDECIVLFNDRDIENWYVEGGVKAPNTFRRHDFSDALAIVGVRNLQRSIAGYLADGVELRYDESNKVQLKSGTIESTTPLWKQTGEFQVTEDAQFDKEITVEENAFVKGGLQIGGTVESIGGGGALNVDADITQQPGRILTAGNGTSGTFTTNDGKTVTVVSGIITNIV